MIESQLEFLRYASSFARQHRHARSPSPPGVEYQHTSGKTVHDTDDTATADGKRFADVTSSMRVLVKIGRLRRLYRSDVTMAEKSRMLCLRLAPHADRSPALIHR